MTKTIRTISISLLAMLIAVVPVLCCCLINPVHASVSSEVAQPADLPPCHAASEPQTSKGSQDCDCAKLLAERLSDKNMLSLNVVDTKSFNGHFALAFGSLTINSPDSIPISLLTTSPPRVLSIPLFLKNPSLRI